MAASGLTIDVTGPGGMGVKEVQPGLFTGEIWATVTGDNEILDDDGLNKVTGGLLITGGGTFSPFDPATNYEPPFNANMIPVDLSEDGKMLGHEGAMTPAIPGVLHFRSSSLNVPGNGPFKLGTFQADLDAGDSVQFLLSGKSAVMYRFQVDGVSKYGYLDYDNIHLGAPLVAVPEPSTFVLLGMSVIGVFAWFRRRGR
jgi:hypothetical protein